MESTAASARAAAFPATIGRYQLRALLGTGGAASVFLARATGIGGFARDVAVKLLHPHLARESAFVEDFLREAKLAARIRHPHVVSVLDVGETADGVFLVMDYVEGVSLGELVKGPDANPLSLPMALRVLSDALSGLHAAHELRDDDGAPLGLVHRDFTPHNLLVSVTGATLLADFGIAKPTRSPGHTRTGVVKGKIPYMAPEQVRGRALDRRCDVWAAGAVAWELLAGRPLFTDEDETAILLHITTQRAPSLGAVRPDLPAALIAAVDRALEPEVDARWPDAEAFRAALLKGAGVPVADDAVLARLVAAAAGPELARRQRAPEDATSKVRGTEPTLAALAPRPTRGTPRWLLATAVSVVATGAVLLALQVSQRNAARTTATIPLPAAPAPTPAAPAEAPVVPPVVAPAAPPERAVRPVRPVSRGKKTQDPPMAKNPYR